MKLNRTPNPLDRIARNGENDNWSVIEGEFRTIGDRVDNIVDEITEEALGEVIDNAKLNWKEPVNSYNELPSVAIKGDTVMDRSTGKVYRYDGSKWVEIQQIDAGPVNELDSRLTSQLNDTAKGINYNRHQSNVTRNKIRPVLVIVDDDTNKTAYNIMFEEFVKNRDIPMSFALISGRVGVDGNTIDMNQFYEMKNDERVEFLNHTENHPQLSTLTDSEIDSEIRLAEEWLNRHGIFTNTLVPPFGAVDERVRDIALKYCDSILVTDSAVSDINNKLLMTEKIQRVEFSRPLADIKGYLDQAKSKNGLMVLSCHSHYSQNESSSLNFVPSKLHDVIDYAQANGIEIMKWTDAFQIFKNPIEYFIDDRVKKGINALGQSIGFGTLDSKMQGDRVFDEVSLEAPPSFYPPSQLTKQYIYESRAIQLGFPGAGTLITSTENNDAYGAQFFLRSRYKSLLYRYWASNNEWTDWHELLNDNYQMYRLPNVKPSFTSSPGAFPANTVSLYTISSAEATSLGWEGAGTLKMHNSPNPGYAYQEFIPYRSTLVKRRYWHSAENKWSDFE